MFITTKSTATSHEGVAGTSHEPMSETQYSYGSLIDCQDAWPMIIVKTRAYSTSHKDSRERRLVTEIICHGESKPHDILNDKCLRESGGKQSLVSNQN